MHTDPYITHTVEKWQVEQRTRQPLGSDYAAEAARAYGRIYAAVRAHVRTPRRRLANLFIAAVALANDLPVVTRNGANYAGLDDLVEVIEV
jgi:predicted nucleic acid-binding protein